MEVFIASDKDGLALKDYLVEELKGYDFNLDDVSPDNGTFVESVEELVSHLQNNENALAIAIDAYGAGSFIAATKHKNIVAAEVSDERSAYMTREHNNSRMITMGSQIVGKELAKNIALYFLRAKYDGGRHQIRVDMLNKMC